MNKINVINGPNLNLLGSRNPNIYGKESLDELTSEIVIYGKKNNIKIECMQTNHEGIIIDSLHEFSKHTDGIILNAGAYTHYSYAIRDAIEAIRIPVVEVHISNISNREKFRQKSVISDVCLKTINGHGYTGYLEAADVLIQYFINNKL